MEDDPVVAPSLPFLSLDFYQPWLLCRAKPVPWTGFDVLDAQEVDLPESLQTLTLGDSFNQSLSGVAVPPSSLRTMDPTRDVNRGNVWKDQHGSIERQNW